MGHKKVLVLAEYGWRNGGENSWIAVAKLLIERGWVFFVACPPLSELSNMLEAEGFATVGWNVSDENGDRKSQAQIRLELANLICEIQPALVHCNSLATARLAGPVTDALDLPALGYLRDIIHLSRQAIDDINLLASIIAVSQATRTFHTDQGICPEKTQVIHNGVNLDEFYPQAATGNLHAELQIPKQNRLITCIGQIGMRKGTDTVIKSFLELANTFADIDLLIVGMRNSGKEEAVEFERHCRQLTESSGTQHRIHWLGRRADVSKILSESSLLLHGARQEPLGRVLLEAAASGCPFVATDVGGTKEIVQGGGCDFLIVSADAVAEMVITAQVLLQDEFLIRATGRRLRHIAVSNFDAKMSAGKLHRTYANLVFGNQASA